MPEEKERFLSQASEILADGGSIFLRRVEWPRDSLSPHLFFEAFAANHDPEDHALFGGEAIAWRWRIECEHIDSMAIHSHESGLLEMPRDHPFLWHLTNDSRSLYFKNVPRDTNALLGALLRTHSTAGDGLLPFLPVPQLVARLEGGHGLLARGPEALLRGYASALEQQGCRSSIIGGRDPLAQPDKLYLGYDLLLWERTSFVIAEQLRFVREM